MRTSNKKSIKTRSPLRYKLTGPPGCMSGYQLGKRNSVSYGTTLTVDEKETRTKKRKEAKKARKQNWS